MFKKICCVMIVLAIAVSMFAMPYASAAEGFDTNMTG